MSSRTLIIAAASALLLAAAVTELSSRLFPGNYFALLVLSFIALSLNGLFNVRQHAADQRAAVPAARDSGRTAERKGAVRTAAQPEKGHSTDRRGSSDRPRGRSGGDQQREARSDRPRRQEPDRAAAPPPSGPREEGTVKWFDRSKGFGFVIRADGEEIFVHQRSIRSEGDRGRPNLTDGATVSFVVTESQRGRQAEDVTLTED